MLQKFSPLSCFFPSRLIAGLLMSVMSMYAAAPSIAEEPHSIKPLWIREVNSNDYIAYARALSGTDGSTSQPFLNVVGLGASKELGEPYHGGNPGGKSRWFVWSLPPTATSSFKVEFNTTGSNYNTLLGLYTPYGTPVTVSNLLPIVQNDDSGANFTSQVQFTAKPGFGYFIAVDGYNGVEGDIILNWRTIGVAPANDYFDDAQLLSGDSGTVTGTNVNAYRDMGEPAPTALSDNYTVWYKWTPTSTGTATFNTHGSDFDTTMGVYTGTAVNALNLIANNDNSNSGDTTSEVEFAVTAGTTYYIVVTGASASAGNITLNWNRALSLGGRVVNSSGVGVRGVDIALNDSPLSLTTTDANGYFSVPDLLPGTYKVTPSAKNLVFTPLSRTVTLTSASAAANFIAKTKVNPSLTVSNVIVTEGNSGTTNAPFIVALSAPCAQPVTVRYATSDSSAINPNDYNSTSNQLTFAPGETSKIVNVAVKGDNIDEANETFYLKLSNPTVVLISDDTGVGTIVDDDAPPTVSIESNSISEGNSGTKTLNFTVRLSAPSSKTVTASAKTIPDSATATTEPAIAGSDYLALPATTITFAPGELVKTVAVTINGDIADELNETFKVVLSAAGNATLGTSTATGTISDDDVVPTFSISNISLTEGDNGTTNAAFILTLSAPSGRTVNVTSTIVSGTALAGADYVAQPVTVQRFQPGQTTKTINVPVIGDRTTEANESFQLKLSDAVNAVITDSNSVATIFDNDPQPSISVTSPFVREGTSGQTALSFVLKLSNPSSKAITLKVQTTPPAAPAATPGVDFVAIPLTTITIPPDAIQQNVDVLVNSDSIREPNEKVGLTLGAPTNATLTTFYIEGTILDSVSASPTNSVGTSKVSSSES